MENKILCGLDEAGRGPLAGPVSAGAVILPPDFPVEILNDSKKLSEKKRKEAEIIIKEKALWGLGLIDHEIIDRINILRASLLAMKNAFDMVMMKFDDWVEKNKLDKSIFNKSNILCIADGNQIPDVSAECRSEVKADARFECVMAASIIAKVARDEIMISYDRLYPQYGYKKHKGYPTPEHKKICTEIGPSPIQRLTFKY
ncbi:MAG: ribonuclease HII [Treponema sp.]|uniref:ribonuclease HII n=1 Tax=Treponema sp. TaxID=166 RepID=UPI001B3CD75F|nr:ribonuclease HII [Treponema sp.]MBP5402929.1 ribonuclease HII [Treponema sp.]MBR5932983.1 ribonuclease HII [Treponema sp.]